MKKFLAILLALFLVVMRVACSGDVETPEGSSSSDYSSDIYVQYDLGNEDDSSQLPWQEELKLINEADLPENLHFKLEVPNTAVKIYEGWKLGKDVLVHYYDNDATGSNDEWKYYKMVERLDEDGIYRAYQVYYQRDKKGMDQPFYISYDEADLDDPFTVFLWKNYKYNFTEGPKERKNIGGYDCTRYVDPTAIPEVATDVTECYVDASNIVRYRVYGDGNPCQYFSIWDENLTGFPAKIITIDSYEE